MSTDRERACLDYGLYLDINRLIRAGLRTGTNRVRLNDDPADPSEITISAHMEDDHALRWIRLKFPGFDQTIGLTTVPRHFSGRQWYFLCPMTGDRASVLWMPRGHNAFASQSYSRQRGMAYRSQLLSPVDRADLGIDRIGKRLVSGEDDTLYKPKWMRRHTFRQLCQRLDAYQEAVNDYTIRVAAQLMTVADRLTAMAARRAARRR